jgi:hypothetical protein
VREKLDFNKVLLKDAKFKRTKYTQELEKKPVGKQMIEKVSEFCKQLRDTMKEDVEERKRLGELSYQIGVKLETVKINLIGRRGIMSRVDSARG